MEAIQNVVASATHRNIWTRLGELHWPGRNYLRLAARFPAASRKNGTAGGVWVSAIPTATDGAHRPNGATEGAGGPVVQDSGSNLPASVPAEVVNLTPPEASMQAAVLFQTFRRDIRAWWDGGKKLAEPAIQASEGEYRALSGAQEELYRRWDSSLRTLLLRRDSSRLTVQMKLDALCEFAAHQLYDSSPVALYAILVVQDVARLSGLNTLEVDRLSVTCRALCSALTEVAGSAGTFMT